MNGCKQLAFIAVCVVDHVTHQWDIITCILKIVVGSMDLFNLLRRVLSNKLVSYYYTTTVLVVVILVYSNFSILIYY